MLDSYGDTRTESVLCILCGRKIEYKTYEPEFGHAGESLSVGKCIELDGSQDLQVAQLLKIVRHIPWDENSVGAADILEIITGLESSPEQYHYGGFKIPNFGDDKNCVFCICRTCCTQSWVMVKNQLMEAIDGRKKVPNPA